MLVMTTGCRDGRARNEIGISPHGFTLGGRDFPVLSGTFDYWTASRDNWKSIFTYVARIGVNTVQSSVPWSIHESGKNDFDFGSAGDSGYLGDFIELAADHGLKVILNIGPSFSPLIQGWGIPARVLEKGACVLQNSSGAPTVLESAGFWSAVPSLSAAAFLDEYFLYLDNLAEYLNDYLYPVTGGPVIALGMQSGIEKRGGADFDPFDADYSGAIVADYIDWLKSRYSEDIGRLNNVYGTGYSQFENILPPKDFLAESMQQLPLYFDWERFGAWKKKEFVEKCALRLESGGVTGMPLLCWSNQDSFPIKEETALKDRGIFAMLSTGFNSAQISERETQDLYGKLSASSELPFCKSLISGEYASGLPGSASVSEWEFSVLFALMNGVRALNSNRLVEFDRWYGCPLSNSGMPEDEFYDICSSLFRFIREGRLQSFDRRAEIAVLENSSLRCIERAKKIIDNAVPLLNVNLFEETVDYGFDFTPEECYTWHSQLGEMLDDVGFEWIQAGRASDISAIDRFKVLIMPAMDFIYERDLDALQKCIDTGGRVLYGPGRPYLNGQLQLSRKVAGFFADSVVSSAILDSRNTGGVPDSIAKSAIDTSALIYVRNSLEFPDLLNEFETGPSFSRTRKEIKLSEHVSGQRKILYAANLSDSELRCEIFFQGRLGFRGLWRAEDREHALGKITVTMQPRSVSVWEVEE